MNNIHKGRTADIDGEVRREATRKSRLEELLLANQVLRLACSAHSVEEGAARCIIQ